MTGSRRRPPRSGRLAARRTAEPGGERPAPATSSRARLPPAPPVGESSRVPRVPRRRGGARRARGPGRPGTTRRRAARFSSTGAAHLQPGNVPAGDLVAGGRAGGRHQHWERSGWPVEVRVEARGGRRPSIARIAAVGASWWPAPPRRCAAATPNRLGIARDTDRLIRRRRAKRRTRAPENKPVASAWFLWCRPIVGKSRAAAVDGSGWELGA
jgi:hypothetical protein